jgi:SAM-dependent methyltransferase
VGAVEGMGPAGYGDAFADVYDDWYADPAATEAAARRLEALAGGGRVLELGVGTGRLALALAARGVAVVGIDASPAMLERLRSKPGAEHVDAVLGDFADVPADGEFAVIVASYNTLFNLPTEGAQRRCLRAAGARLASGGAVVVEGFVPDPDAPTAAVTPKVVDGDQVVLHASVVDHAAQTVRSQHITIGRDGIRLRPSFIRWSTPDQLDEMAAAAGLALVARHAGWDAEPFGPDSPVHVSHYRRAPEARAGRDTTPRAADGTVSGE